MKTKEQYKQCALSVMDTIADPDITFDKKGISNYYYDYQKGAAEHLKKVTQGKKHWMNLLQRLKKMVRASLTIASWD